MMNLSSSKSSLKYIMVSMLLTKETKKYFYLNVLCIYYIIFYMLSTLKARNACLVNKVQREFHITMANLVLCPILGRSKTTMTNRVGISFSYLSSWYKGEVWGWVSSGVSLSLGIALVHCRVALRKVSSPKIPWKSSTLTNQKPLISRFLVFCETLKAYGFLNFLFSHKTKKDSEREIVSSLLVSGKLDFYTS